MCPSELVDRFQTIQDIHTSTQNTRSAINNKLYFPHPNLSLYKKVFLIMVLCTGITFPIYIKWKIVLNSILKITLYHRYELSHAFYFASCIKYVLMCFCLVIFTYLLIYIVTNIF